MTDTLHTRLLAAVQQRMDVARAASDEDGPFDGTGIVTMRLHHGGTRTVTLTSGIARFLAANDPATVLRHCARDLAVLERHANTEGNCPSCGRFWDDWVYDPEAGEEFHETEWTPQSWPCVEIVELATAYGVDVDGG